MRDSKHPSHSKTLLNKGLSEDLVRDESLFDSHSLFRV